MQDWLVLAFIVIAGPLAIIGPISFGLQFFVALGSPPSQRAGWTAGIAYLTVSLLLALGVPRDYALWAPLAALPAGFIAFWYWRRDFRRAWIANPQSLPDGISLANDDWRIGILRLLECLAGSILVAVLRILTGDF